MAITLPHLKKYNVFFAKDSSSGNPAAVVNVVDKDNTMLEKYARELNLPITVFLFPPEAGKKDAAPKIRFFYPNRETDICVHGALAAAYHLLNEQDYSNITVINKKNVGLLLSKDNGQYYINLNTEKIINKPFDSKVILKMLRLDKSDLDLRLPFKIASSGSQKLLIPVKSLSILRDIQPQFDKISQWGQENAVNGFYVYTTETLDQNSDFHARNFNPLSGQPEDIATGIAAAALASCFVETGKPRNFCIEQGFFLQNPCLIYVYIHNDQLKVGGNVAAT